MRLLSFDFALKLPKKGDIVKKFFIEREEYVNKTFKFSTKLVERMNKVCDNKNVSLNKLVVKCIEYALDNSDLEADDIEK